MLAVDESEELREELAVDDSEELAVDESEELREELAVELCEVEAEVYV
ncbi:MAG: hypothetical protein JSW58_08395 [Candidatus Latescibacterota bacterium]|nr:MAG: hypothetical protein JSW58_08395 [Candidatus Latescibacterota bacterium]